MLSGLGETRSRLLFALWQEMVSSTDTETVDTVCFVAIVKRKIV